MAMIAKTIKLGMVMASLLSMISMSSSTVSDTIVDAVGVASSLLAANVGSSIASTTSGGDNIKTNINSNVENNKKPVKKSKNYKILPPSTILQRLQNLAQTYPQFTTLTTTQEWFHLPRAGGRNDCAFDSNYVGENGSSGGGGCNVYVLVIHDKLAFPDDPDAGVSTGVYAGAGVDLDAGSFGSMGSNIDNATAESESQWRNQEASPTEINLDENVRESESEHENKRRSSSGWQYVPDVFLSGAVHGDERVGPTTLVELAELLLEAANCEALGLSNSRGNSNDGTRKNNRQKYKNPAKSRIDDSSSNNDSSDSRENLIRLQKCRSALNQKNISPTQRQWLHRLVTTRRTVIVPTANALGYARKERGEDGMDPNRDFPFDLIPTNSDNSNERTSDQCMRTVAGRSINELFLSHLFSIGLTYHGGMEAIGYEWGAPTYVDRDAPDVYAQDVIAAGYSRYGGEFDGSEKYEYGSMNDLVYYVRGGMEDWAFAGSWDPERVVQCVPTTYGGNYPISKTRYNNSTLRAFNMLIETSNLKTPIRSTLGNEQDPLSFQKESHKVNNGHIARNIRLALLAMDVVEPYVWIHNWDGEEELLLHYDFKKSSRMIYSPCSERNNDELGLEYKAANTRVITFSVGGAFDIDEAELFYGPWESLSKNLASQDGFYPSSKTVNVLNSNEFTKVSPSNIRNGGGIQGRSRWHKRGPHPTISTAEQDKDNLDPMFQVEIDLSSFSEGTQLAIIARAKVDNKWKTQSQNVGPSGLGGAVSHIVNARTNPSYFATNAGKVIRGRDGNWWYSVPVTLEVGSDNSRGRFDSDRLLEILSREKLTNASFRYGRDAEGSSVDTSTMALGILALVFMSFIVGKWALAKQRHNYRSNAQEASRGNATTGHIRYTTTYEAITVDSDIGTKANHV